MELFIYAILSLLALFLFMRWFTYPYIMPKQQKEMVESLQSIAKSLEDIRDILYDSTYGSSEE